jgi:hypothetical protein
MLRELEQRNLDSRLARLPELLTLLWSPLAL